MHYQTEHCLWRRPSVYAVLGGLAGVLVGLVVSSQWPQIPLHATATHGQETFAIATGPVDERMEAIYFLDYLTGDLRAAVVQPQTGKFSAFFAYNVLQDFGGANLKNPKFAMVTGMADMPQARQNFRYAKSLIYIAEGTTGKVACYGLPWNPSLQAGLKAQAGTFVPMDMGVFRAAAIRE